MLTIEPTWMEDYFAVAGGARATSVEGHRDEWKVVAKTMRDGLNVHFRRVATQIQKDGSYRLYSPRNAIDVDDCERCAAADVAAFADRIEAVLQEHPSKPKVVCICGSTRFAAAMNEAAEQLTLAGKIVVRPEVVTYRAERDVQRVAPEVKAQLDELHLRKIDLADEVLVVNVGGYVGESTTREIAYARKKGKPVAFLEPEAAPAEKGA